MTQHIEEARKLEPVAGYRRRLPQYGFAHYEFEQPDYENPSIADWEPLVRLSDAQAALAAADERGRSEERERCAMEDGAGVETLTHEMRERMISEMNGLVEFLTENPDNIYHLDADKVQLLRAAITKEPTP